MASKYYRRKPITKRKSNTKNRWIFYLISIVLLFFVAIGIYKFRDGFLYYLGLKDQEPSINWKIYTTWELPPKLLTYRDWETDRKSVV